MAGQSIGTGNTAPALTTVTVLLFSWGLLTFVVRLWIKLSKRDGWGIDDTAVSISASATLFGVVATCYAIHRGYGNAWPTLLDADKMAIQKALYSAQFFYVTSTGLIRASASLFAASFLARSDRSSRVANSLTLTCGLWVVASILAIALREKLSHPWLTLDGTEPMFRRWLGIEISGVAIDLAAVAVSIGFIWTLQMPLKKRLIISGIFCIRLVVTTPLIVLRLYALSPHHNPDATLPSLRADMFTQAVMQSMFILASITCLKPFLRPFHSGYFVTSASANIASAYNTGPKTSRSDTYYELSAARSIASKRKSQAVVVRERERERARDEGRDDVDLIRRHVEGRPVLRTDCYTPEVTVQSFNFGHGGAEGDPGQISRTQAWTVSYDR